MVLSTDRLRLLLGLQEQDESQNVFLEFILQNVEEIVMNYCHLKQFPDGLINTGYRMAIDLYRNEELGSATGSGITSIAEGDTTVSFGTSTYDDSFKSSLLKKYESQLNAYRKLGW